MIDPMGRSHFESVLVHAGFAEKLKEAVFFKKI